MQQVWPSSSFAVSSISWHPMASSPSCSRVPSKVTHSPEDPDTKVRPVPENAANSVCFIDGTFLRTLATSLMDFNELSSIAALSQLLEVGLQEERPRPQPVSGTTPVSSMNRFMVLCCILGLAPSLYEQHREVPLMSPCPAVARKKAAAAIINSSSLYSGGFFPAGIIHCLLSIQSPKL